MTYGTWFSDVASQAMLALPDHAFADIDSAVVLLATNPELGRSYDPLYEAARPAQDLHVMYAGNYGIYYTPDHDRRLIRVHFIEDQRMDPTTRFSGRLR